VNWTGKTNLEIFRVKTFSGLRSGPSELSAPTSPSSLSNPSGLFGPSSPCSLPRLSMLLTLAMIAFSICLMGCTKKEEAKRDNEEPAIPSVQIRKQILDRTDQLPGEISAYQDVAIYPKVAGFVQWIGVDRGSIVKKDQLLVKMFAPEFLATRSEFISKAAAAKASLHESESKLSSARASLLEMKAKLAGDNDTYLRTKEASLVPGVVATNEVIVLGDMVKSDQERVHSWEENVKSAQNQVKASIESEEAARKAAEDFRDIAAYLNVTAPFDGYITERNMHVGSLVGPLGKGAYPAIVRIQQLNLLRVVTPVPERDVAGILPGAKVEFSVSAYPGTMFLGTVARMGNYLDQSTRTEPVELNYWNSDYKIKPGMFCEVYWPTRRPRPTLFVPITSVAVTTRDTFVDKIESGIVKWVNVRRGQTMGKWVEVFPEPVGALKEGDVVAVLGTDELRPDAKVNAVLTDSEKIESKPERPGYVHGGMGAPATENGKISASDQDKQPK
jgi:membrane fusion protein, multidrug efflux system